ncbi:MAG: hypothetical protein ACJ77A_02265 [Actinomycetota bacterium]
MARRLFALALITVSLGMLGGLTTSASAAGPVPETQYYFHAGSSPIDGTFNTAAPTSGSATLFTGAPILNAPRFTGADGSIGGMIDTLRIDVWQHAPVCEPTSVVLTCVTYDVQLTVGTTEYTFTFDAPSPASTDFTEVRHTFTSADASSPLPIDATGQHVDIVVRGHYLVNEAVTVLAYDSTSTPSGFAVNVPPPTDGSQIPSPGLATGSVGFTTPVTLPQSDGYGEPSLAVAPVGSQGTAGQPQTLWATAPRGLTSSATGNRASPVWRSDDGGRNWAGPITTSNVGPAETGLGGGDTDIRTDKRGNAYQLDLWLGDDSMSFSTDKGSTWTGSPISHIHLGDDRAWLAYSEKEDALYQTYDGLSGVYIDKAPLNTPAGPNAALVFPQESLVVDNASRACVCSPGSLFVDDSRAGSTPYVYVVLQGADGLDLWRSDDGGLTFTHSVVPQSGAGTTTANLFAVGTVDAAGNVYVAWSEKKGATYEVYYASSTDHGRTFQGPFDASALIGPAHTAVMPAIAADEAGHVALSFYGTPQAVDPEAHSSAVWNVYYLESRNGASGSPAFTVSTALPGAHEGQICLSGANCSDTDDRSLLDFFSVVFDANHLANIVATKGNLAQGTVVQFVKATGGSAATGTTLTYTGDTGATKGATATYAAILLDTSGNPVSGAPVAFQLGSLPPVNGTTNASGVATATQAISLDAGTYQLKADYAGDATRGASSTTAQFTVSAPAPTFGDVSLAQVGPKDRGGEPSIATGPEGNLYVSYPGSNMDFFRSADQGKTWTAGAIAANHSGDTSVNVDSSGAVYQSNLNGIQLNPDTLQGVVFKSTDFGAHWTQGGGFITQTNSSNQPFLVDRQWADAYIPPGKTTDQALVYFTYHDWGPNQIWVNRSSDGGRTFGPPVDVITSPEAQAASLCDTIPGGIKVVKSGPHAGRIYDAWLGGSLATNAATGCNVTQLNTFSTIWIAYSDDQGATWTDRLIFDGGFGHDASGLFADLTLDDQGNPYVAFADNLTDEWDVYVMASFDGGITWNGKSDGTGSPYKVNADTGTHFFPSIAVGDPGRVDVAYLGTDKLIDQTPYGKPTPGGGAGGVWRLYMAQSTNLASGNPTWSVVQATPTPMHIGDVCTLGIFCIGELGSNRDLLDFIDISVGVDGFAHAAYTDDNLATGIWAANQVSGIRAYAPQLSLAGGNPASGAYTTTVSVSANTSYVDAGTPVTFTLGSQSATAPVGAGGVATATLALTQAPGAYTLTARAAGLSASAPFAITKDGTLMTVVRGTSTLTATLMAVGSNAPVAGRTVTFFVNGKKAGAATTNASGVATLKKTVRRGSTVRAVFAGDGFFTGSEATTTN